MSSKTFAIDAAPGLIKRALGLAALTADAYVGSQHDQGDAAITDLVCVVDIESCKVSAGDETYTLRLVGSNSADRSDAQILDTLELGDAGTIPVATVDTVPGDRFVMRARTERQDTSFRYIDLHLDVAGTSPSIGFGAFLSKEIV
ncbi:hypothetical protein [Oceanicola sp. S124]|uniref:hypothetical protein n=1 Tax=Oceanicola sp. S124 TaxID=1042378 RepID=UPI000255A960|nr:hypothetical protein [Oceanicola sp. S124]